MTGEQLKLGQTVRRAAPPARPRGPFEVPPGDFARPGLVDQAFVERSVAAMRDLPDAERQLRRDMAERLESMHGIDLLYREELNEWAAATRERLWLEYFTADAILQRLRALPVPGAARPAMADRCPLHSASASVVQ